MGLSLSLLSWTRFEVVKAKIFGLTEAKAALVKSISFGEKDVKMALRSLSFKRSNSATKRESNQPANGALERSLSFKNWEQEGNKLEATVASKNPAMDDARPVPISLNSAVKKGAALDMKSPGTLHGFSSPRPLCELAAAATTVQKIYKSYRTRRNLADCAVVVEEFWWKALDFASLERSSVSFFDVEKTETAVSRWSRARTRAAKVGKGLSKDEKAQKLALQHWLEAIDPRHRYGHNLHIYYDVWFASESTEPFFYWLDVGYGREVNLEKCPRSKLHSQCIKYLGPNERESYEVIVEDGKLVYKQNQTFVNTTEGSKWIFVLSTSRALYVGQKRKGTFQHSSFLSGAATTAAGRLIAEEGNLKAIWPYSGHYLPTEENFKEFISFLQDNNVDLSNVKRCSVDDDEYPSITKNDSVPAAEIPKVAKVVEAAIEANKVEEPQEEAAKSDHVIANTMDKAAAFEILGRRMSRKWNSPTGARIGCVRDYPAELQHKALEQVNLSPRVLTSPMGSKIPIPSPRPSPNMRLSPRLQYMGIPTPTVSLTLPKPKRI